MCLAVVVAVVFAVYSMSLMRTQVFNGDDNACVVHVVVHRGVVTV